MYRVRRAKPDAALATTRSALLRKPRYLVRFRNPAANKKRKRGSDIAESWTSTMTGDAPSRKVVITPAQNRCVVR
jgi:hypothetical protein